LPHGQDNQPHGAGVHPKAGLFPKVKTGRSAGEIAPLIGDQSNRSRTDRTINGMAPASARRWAEGGTFFPKVKTGRSAGEIAPLISDQSDYCRTDRTINGMAPAPARRSIAGRTFFPKVKTNRSNIRR